MLVRPYKRKPWPCEANLATNPVIWNHIILSPTDSLRKYCQGRRAVSKNMEYHRPSDGTFSLSSRNCHKVQRRDQQLQHNPIVLNRGLLKRIVISH